MAVASVATKTLLALADAFAAHEFRSHEALSGMAVGKGGFFVGLQRGGDCRTATAERVLSWFDLNWPKDLAWPEGIQRPSRAGLLSDAIAELSGQVTEPSAEFLARLSHLPIWVNGRRPTWWDDAEVREFLNNLPILQMGAKGMFVRDLQIKLVGLGYAVGAKDGDFGPRVRDAVMAFQAENGLVSDGIVGAKTWAAFDTAKKRAARPVTRNVLVARGSRTIQQAQKVIIGGVGRGTGWGRRRRRPIARWGYA